MKKVKITVVEVSDFNKIHEVKDLGCTANIASKCGKFMVGQEFITDMQYIPEGFCPYAFRDIAHHIIMLGEGKVIVCCTDGFRPVFFRLEIIED